MWPEGGEWEPIKITHRNLAYIPNRTQCPSLLTRLGPHNYRITIGPRNRVRNRSGNTNQCQQEHMQGKGNQNQINKQLKTLCTFHETPSVCKLENMVWVQYGLGNLESFDLVTQEIYWFHPATIHTQEHERKIETWVEPKQTVLEKSQRKLYLASHMPKRRTMNQINRTRQAH
jgi:hypothetical protein